NDDGAFVGPCVDQLAVPTPGSKQLVPDLLERKGKYGVQELVCDSSDRILHRPAVQLLGSAIPVSDSIVHVAHENRVVREIQQAGLLGSFRDFDFETIARLSKIPLHAPPQRAEPSDQQSERHEHYKVRQVARADIETVERFGKEVSDESG